VEAGIRQVIAFIEAHGSSRFDPAWEENAERVIVNRAGFRRRSDRGGWEYMVLPEQWRSELAKGFNPSALANAMVERGLMVPANDGKPAKPMKVKGQGTMRLYVLAPGIISDEEEAADAS
jgi:putative DNA primase/helicase